MNTQILLFGISIFYSVFGFSLQEKPLVKVSQGILQGTTVLTKNGRRISAFQGIPYGQPPIGELRFSNPLPAKAWDGVLHLANKTPTRCAQISKSNEILTDEDCLFLNVFTPLLNFEYKRMNRTVKNIFLPVMVYIHGGAFQNGDSSVFGPTFLLDKDIVLVTMHYRLGIFGFMTTGDSVSPGNFGLKDQVLALKWVQENIRSFGGDPDQVTLFGESAGGASVHFHALSEASDGLFHKYIFQSGTAANPWAFRKRNDYKPIVNELARKVGCSNASSAVLVECLRKTSATKLLTSRIHLNIDFPVLAWTPTDELESEEAFLTDSPKNLVAQNKMKDYPFLSGTVHDEGLLTTMNFYKSSSPFKTITNYAEKCIDNLLQYYLASKDLPKFKPLVKDYYFKDSIASANKSELLASYTKLVSDGGFFYPLLRVLENRAKVAKNPFYFYSFEYVGNLSTSTETEDIIKLGVPHGAEIFYLFPRLITNSISQEDERVIDTMVDLWTSFAINGKPTSVHLQNPNLWLPYIKNNSLLQIGDVHDSSVTLKNNYFTDRINFWKSLVSA